MFIIDAGLYDDFIGNTSLVLILMGQVRLDERSALDE